MNSSPPVQPLAIAVKPFGPRPEALPQRSLSPRLIAVAAQRGTAVADDRRCSPFRL